jgi:ArsR family transcriptional regulator
MAINKSTEFDISVQNMATLAKALSHPARIEIMKTLAEKNVCICGEIVEVLPLSQSTVSQHLKELKSAGLIKGEVEGKKSCYCVNWDVLNAFIENLNNWNNNLIKLKENCC